MDGQTAAYKFPVNLYRAAGTLARYARDRHVDVAAADYFMETFSHNTPSLKIGLRELP